MSESDEEIVDMNVGIRQDLSRIKKRTSAICSRKFFLIIIMFDHSYFFCRKSGTFRDLASTLLRRFTGF